MQNVSIKKEHGKQAFVRAWHFIAALGMPNIALNCAQSTDSETSRPFAALLVRNKQLCITKVQAQAVVKEKQTKNEERLKIQQDCLSLSTMQYLVVTHSYST